MSKTATRPSSLRFDKVRGWDHEWALPCRDKLALVDAFDDAISGSSSHHQQHQQKKTSVAFLKTHKTGSTTVQNVLLRFGDTNGLTFLLPATGNHVLRKSRIPAWLDPAAAAISAAAAAAAADDDDDHHLMLAMAAAVLDNSSSTSTSSSNNNKADIFCLHTDYSMEDIAQVVKHDATWVTILRNPDSLFESLYRRDRLCSSRRGHTSNDDGGVIDSRESTVIRRPMYSTSKNQYYIHLIINKIVPICADRRTVIVSDFVRSVMRSTSPAIYSIDSAYEGRTSVLPPSAVSRSTQYEDVDRGRVVLV